tara:strand:- start:1290 stop:1679 length:390 start_codon:yes stop_codon:yes gene_type:complete
MENWKDPLILDESMAPLDAEQIAILAPDNDNEDSMLGDLLEVFIAESESRLAEIAQFCQAQDAQALRVPVHFIAGSAANLGAARISQLCRQVEVAILDDSFDGYSDLPQILQNEYQVGLSALKEVVRTN